MERDDKRLTTGDRRDHRRRRDEGVVALAVDQVPSAGDDGRADARCEVEVEVSGPGANPNDAHPFDGLFSSGQWLERRRQHRHVMAASDHPARHLSGVDLRAADEGA